MKSQEIRIAFTDFFTRKGHTAVASSSLVPHDDPTLLFTNAGMVQFKDVFLGNTIQKNTRATSIQKCVRAGGKHNDLENVGFTARHHTFFEMLGNFSFGDYFKREAIFFAWELLTEVFKIPPHKLWITVFTEDQEAFDIWAHEIGVDQQRIARIGAKDNFWAMGETGPCGPCTEIFYDHGAHIPGGPPGTPESELDRYVEIWNLVFMQYNRDETGKLVLLPKPSVDTGMGLERIAAVMQGVHDNYDIDTFKALIVGAAQLTNTGDIQCQSLRVIADHIRSVSFLIAEGVIPDNEGRGYVLRRIIRRAIRHGYLLGMREPFFYKLVNVLAGIMGEAYPELVLKTTHISQIVKQEEQQFLRTLSQGIRLFDEAVNQLTADIIPGEIIFKLYDTYGFPVDLTADMAKERQLILDMPAFESCMAQQRLRARQASKFTLNQHEPLEFAERSEFSGYESLIRPAVISGIYNDNTVIILDHTPFYPEGGGQVGDRGMIRGEDGAEFVVTDTQKKAAAILHVGYVKSGSFAPGNHIEAAVNNEQRQFTARNHSATHLLHAALQKLLGTHIQQKGSYVSDAILRFDFSHSKPLTINEKTAIEKLVNNYISADYKAEIQTMSVAAAKEIGAMALFGEKYGDEVRVLKFGDVSIELCGGTHISHTSEIGLFKITGESGIAAGIRRVEAVTSLKAITYLDQEISTMQAHLRQLENDLKNLQKQNEILERERVLADLPTRLLLQKQVANGINLVAEEITPTEFKQAQAVIAEVQRQYEQDIIIALSCRTDTKTSLIVALTPALTRRFKAVELLNAMLMPIGGKGGGRAELAQGGGGWIENLTPLWKTLSNTL